MKRISLAVALATAVFVSPELSVVKAQDVPARVGAAAYGDWRGDAPGVRRLIRPEDMPVPVVSSLVSNIPSVVTAAGGALPRVPAGFAATRWASGLRAPQVMRVAPNGDVFVAETGANRIRVLRAADGASRAEQSEIFAAGLAQPFGIAFWPPGPSARYIYVGTLDRVVRFPWRPGELRPAGRAETVTLLPSAGDNYATRDVQFTPDGARMLVSVESASNVADGMGRRTVDQARLWDAQHGAIGMGWGIETGRATVLAFDPDGRNPAVFATGLRNCVGLAIHPATGEPWCSTSERDGLGDNVPPDYVTRVRAGAFYGWPWFYIGDHEDPRRRGERPDLVGRVTVPDVLIQPHSASLQMTFYPLAPDGAAAFPAEYRGDAFVALHGSWHREVRTGYKVVRIRLRDGVATGEYEDFLTGFVHDDGSVWARPVGVTIARDGALLVADDGNGTIWRVAPAGR